MVKLASARESRLYGSRLTRHRNEYMNGGTYVFSTVVLLAGHLAQFSHEPRSGLVLILIALALISAVNLHDLVAHMSGIDFRLPSMVGLDPQLGLVEFGTPVVQAVGSALSFVGILFVLLQAEKGEPSKYTQDALSLLIAGPMLWLVGSVLNSCQIYERSDGHVQILQQSVHLPFLLASLLFLVGGIINNNERLESDYGLLLLGKNWVWFGMAGSLLLFIGGLANVLKIFKMQNSLLRLEKLRGGAQERLLMVREGQLPLLSSSSAAAERRRKHFFPVSADDLN